ncbi:unnamed protein product [Ophioblennius macclurei]
MAFNKMKPSLYDQITELQRKIQLLEGGRNAHYESSRSSIVKNSEALRQLRQENKRLYRQLADVKAGDEHVIRAAFHNRGLEKHAFRNMSEEEALTTIQQRRLSETKQLNALKHTTKTYQRRLEELKMEYGRQKPEAGTVSPDARRKEEDAMNRRTLENRLEKTQLKCKEGENIMANYLKLKSHLQDESLTFQGQLDNLKEDILKHREELQSMQLIYKDAKVAKEDFKTEMQQLEERLYRERKERERIIASYRRNFEECKAEAEKNDRRAQRATMQPDEVSSEAQRSTTRMAAEEDKAISTLEEVYRNVKEASGTTNMEEIVERFTSQKDTYQHLEKVKVENEAVLLQLKEQKKLLSQQLDQMKYCGEAKLSSERQTLEECEQQLQAQQQKCNPTKEHLDRLTKTLGAARAGVEHLADKLQHISVSEDTDVEDHPHSEETVVELLKQCKLKLQTMHTELQETNMAAVMKEMEEEAFLVRMEGKLPEYNTRIKLPGDQTQELFDDEDEHEEDEADIVSREALKRQSQLIIDSNPKKKPWKKKKGKF